LVYFGPAADAAAWDEHWAETITPEMYAGAKKGDLGLFEEIFPRWLPRDGKILEAGCGAGVRLLSIRARGWDIEGVEWGPDTVERALACWPGLPIRVGDVTALDVPDGYYSGYISLGVVEHRRAGPEPFLTEAYRVLKPGGVALLSVPTMHSLRRLKAALGLYRASGEEQEFYQYAFRKAEFQEFLEAAGFEVVDDMPYDGLKGLGDEVPGLGWLLRQGLRVPVLKRWVKRRLRHSMFGHMLLYVARKPQS
jgi:SAM-dependent methyltransferase